MKFLSIGQYHFYTSCRICNYTKLKKVVNLGLMPLAGSFLPSLKDSAKEKRIPLELVFCPKCFLVQTNAVINSGILFKNYFYHSSSIKTLVAHFEEHIQNFIDKGYSPKKTFIVEIGSNDGAFIKAGIKKGFQMFGVDPASNIVRPLIKKGLPIIDTYFSYKVAKSIVKKFGKKADIIFSSNTLAHIEDMHEIIKGIQYLLSDGGTLIFEVHYLGSVINGLQYDMIYHEHQYYYSLHTVRNLLKQYQMEVYDVELIAMHGGSIRFFVQHLSAKRVIKTSVNRLLTKEIRNGLTSAKTFTTFGDNVKQTKNALVRTLKKIKKEKKKIYGYGASGRGTIIMNYCQLSDRYLDYVIDDAPAKQGMYTPGTHLKVIPSTQLLQDKPDYVVLFAWSFLEEVKTRNKDYLQTGGKFILPLPKVKIIGI